MDLTPPPTALWKDVQPTSFSASPVVLLLLLVDAGHNQWDSRLPVRLRPAGKEGARGSDGPGS